MKIHGINIPDPMIVVANMGSLPELCYCLVRGHRWPSGNSWPSPWSRVVGTDGVLEVTCAHCGRHLVQQEHEASPGGVRFHYE